MGQEVETTTDIPIRLVYQKMENKSHKIQMPFTTDKFLGSRSMSGQTMPSKVKNNVFYLAVPTTHKMEAQLLNMSEATSTPFGYSVLVHLLIDSKCS